MKIVMITPYYPPVIGGITNYVFYLTAFLQKIKTNKITVITRQGDTNIDVHSINTNKILFAIKSFIILYKIKPDVIHSHGSWYTMIPGFVYKSFHVNAMVIHTEHTEPPKNLKFYERTLLKLLYSYNNLITYASENTRNVLEKHYKIHARYKKIHGGVFVKPIKNEDTVEYIKKFGINRTSDGPLIAYLGPLVWQMKVEGVKRLVKSFRIIKKESPDASLLIIGDGQYRKEIETLVRDMKLEKSVILTGSIENPHPLLALCDIYAHISLMDSFPLSILEAMYLGLPVIATKVGDIPELIKNNQNGILVDPDDVSIAKSILELWGDKKKMQLLGDNGKKLVETHYGWDKIANKYMEIYEKSYSL